jgi:hypothetical protein
MVSPCLNYVYVSCMDGIIYKYDIHNAVQRSVCFVFYPDIAVFIIKRAPPLFFRPVSEFSGAQIRNFFIKSSLSHCGRYLVSGSKDNKAS